MAKENLEYPCRKYFILPNMPEENEKGRRKYRSIADPRSSFDFDKPNRRDREADSPTFGNLEKFCSFGEPKRRDTENSRQYIPVNTSILQEIILKKEYISSKEKVPFEIIKYKPLEEYIPKESKELEKIIIPNYNSKQIISSYGGIGIKLGQEVSVNADNIPQFVEPIVEFIRQMRPDYIVACDRGARFIGLAVKALYGEMYGRLPTTDGTVRFRRISKSPSREETKAYLTPLVEEMTSARKNPRVLILDDWICSGSTKQLIEEIFEEMAPRKIDLRYGVLLGNGGDVSGNADKTNSFAGCVEWHDDANLIGLDYRGTKPRVLMGSAARDYRARIFESCKKYAKRVRGEMASQIVKEPKKHSFLTRLKRRDDVNVAA